VIRGERVGVPHHSPRFGVRGAVARVEGVHAPTIVGRTDLHERRLGGAHRLQGRVRLHPQVRHEGFPHGVVQGVEVSLAVFDSVEDALDAPPHSDVETCREAGAGGRERAPRVVGGTVRLLAQHREDLLHDGKTVSGHAASFARETGAGVGVV
jgi:hypothetical protein